MVQITHIFGYDQYQYAPTGVFWDLQNNDVPSCDNCVLLVERFMSALELAGLHPNAETKWFSAFAKSDVPKHKLWRIESLFEVQFIDPVKGVKDLADKKIIVALFDWVSHNFAPLNIVLLSSDGDYIQFLESLRLRGCYNIHLVYIPNKASADTIKSIPSTWEFEDFWLGKAPKTLKYKDAVATALEEEKKKKKKA